MLNVDVWLIIIEMLNDLNLIVSLISSCKFLYKISKVDIFTHNRLKNFCIHNKKFTDDRYIFLGAWGNQQIIEQLDTINFNIYKVFDGMLITKRLSLLKSQMQKVNNNTMFFITQAIKADNVEMFEYLYPLLDQEVEYLINACKTSVCYLILQYGAINVCNAYLKNLPKIFDCLNLYRAIYYPLKPIRHQLQKLNFDIILFHSFNTPYFKDFYGIEKYLIATPEKYKRIVKNICGKLIMRYYRDKQLTLNNNRRDIKKLYDSLIDYRDMQFSPFLSMLRKDYHFIKFDPFTGDKIKINGRVHLNLIKNNILDIEGNLQN